MDEQPTYSLRISHGALGDFKDLNFDDQAWLIRHRVVETGLWLASRKATDLTDCDRQAELEGRDSPGAITSTQVKDSPAIYTEKPVCRQQDREPDDYYGQPHYSGGAGLWGSGMNPYAMMRATAPSVLSIRRARRRTVPQGPGQAAQRDEDTTLRSCAEPISYDIGASDDDIGHLRGFLIDDKTWALRFVVVHTSRWWLGTRC